MNEPPPQCWEFLGTIDLAVRTSSWNCLHTAIKDVRDPKKSFQFRRDCA